jgi:hypothetical protein
MYNTYAIDPSPMKLSGVRSLPEEQQPKSCIACGSCAKKCPQSIDIPGVLAKFAEIIETTPVPGPPPGVKKD